MNLQKVLVLYKRSAYSNYFLNDQSSLHDKESFIPKINLERFKKVHAQHYQALDVVEKCLTRHSVDYVKSNRGQSIDYAKFNFVITVGGDGTFLEGARNVKNQLILGVNSSSQW